MGCCKMKLLASYWRFAFYLTRNFTGYRRRSSWLQFIPISALKPETDFQLTFNFMLLGPETLRTAQNTSRKIVELKPI